MRKVARKSGLRRSAIAILRLYCRFKTDVKIIIQSRDLAGRFCYSLSKSNVFAPLTSLRDVQRKTLLPRARGCTPFLAPQGPKNSLRFSVHKSGLEKIGANNAPKKLLHAIFACPSFAKKIISASLKSSAKEWSSPVARTSVRFVREPRRQKKRACNSLPSLF